MTPTVITNDAEALQVVIVLCAALAQWDAVVNLQEPGRRDQPTALARVPIP